VSDGILIGFFIRLVLEFIALSLTIASRSGNNEAKKITSFLTRSWATSCSLSSTRVIGINNSVTVWKIHARQIFGPRQQFAISFANDHPEFFKNGLRREFLLVIVVTAEGIFIVFYANKNKYQARQLPLISFHSISLLSLPSF
jgi:hypothetical protein